MADIGYQRLYVATDAANVRGIYSIRDWLTGMVADYDVPAQTLDAILRARIGSDGSLIPFEDASEKDKDLSLADLYMSIANSSSKTGSVYDSDGGWQRGRTTKNVVDRSWFRDQANRLYKKWDDPLASNYGKFVMKGIY